MKTFMKIACLALAFILTTTMFISCGQANENENISDIIPEYEGDIYHGDFDFDRDTYSDIIEENIPVGCAL